MNKISTKGFTLIELLVVIGIVAILAVVVILTINPAELLRQARDSNRISDMGTLKSAVSLYLSDAAIPNLGNTANCYVSWATSTCTWFAGGGTVTSVTTTVARKVDGTGWIPVNFSGISSGSPIGNLPVDPVNSGAYMYAYKANSSLQFELDTHMESSRYKHSGSGDVENTDGGDNADVYEVGTAPGLTL